MLAYLWVAIGGALGSMARYGCNGLISAKFGESFPWGTVLVNIAGSFLIGFLGAIAGAEGRLDSQTRAFTTQFFMVGVCGGFTTFSSFSLQTLNLIRDGEFLYAAGNVLLSVALCLLGVWLGYLAGSLVNATKGS